jgi:RNA polymerase sigma-70 factor (ECF subfamily)
VCSSIHHSFFAEKPAFQACWFYSYKHEKSQDRTIFLHIFSKIGKICMKSLILKGLWRMRLTVDDRTRHLVALAQGGDESALNRLCNVYGARVLWIIRLRMGRELRSKLESIDVVQDVLMSALKDLGDFTYKTQGDFLRWLSRIAENRLRGHLQRFHANKRDIRKEVRFDGYRPTAEDSVVAALNAVVTTTPSAIMSKREDLDKLAKAIEALKPEYRQVIVLTKIEGLSYKEIGNRLDKSSEAVRKLVSRALEELIQIFENV